MLRNPGELFNLFSKLENDTQVNFTEKCASLLLSDNPLLLNALGF